MTAEELFEYVEGRMDAGAGEVVIPISGRSMWPFLNPGADRVRLRRCGALRRGDIVLARAYSPEGIFLHRVEAVEAGCVRLKGDNNLRQRELCRPCDVVAVAVAAISRGKERSLVSPLRRRVLPALWRLVLPLKSIVAKSLR